MQYLIGLFLYTFRRLTPETRILSSTIYSLFIYLFLGTSSKINETAAHYLKLNAKWLIPYYKGPQNLYNTCSITNLYNIEQFINSDKFREVTRRV